MISERGDVEARSAFKRELPAQPEAVTLRAGPSPKSTREPNITTLNKFTLHKDHRL